MLTEPLYYYSTILLYRRPKEMDSGTGGFPFPFQPYPIQEQFMEALYATLDQGKVGIFESPTGTVGQGSNGSALLDGKLHVPQCQLPCHMPE